MNIAILTETRNIPLVPVIIEAHMKFLPKWECEFINQMPQGLNRLMTDINFWNKYQGYERVLIYHTDSMLLRDGIDEFLRYDYVGAPWKFQQHGGNGGLSLRNPRAMIGCINSLPYNEHRVNEDVYFSNWLKDHGNLAPREACSKFSVETIFQLGTLGYHAIEKYLSHEQCNEIVYQYK